MSEVLVRFDAVLSTSDGRRFLPRACGRPIEGGRLWEGWVEFVSIPSGDALRTARETEQPSRETLLYWATGLSTTYLEGALRRALEPPVARTPSAAKSSSFAAPASRPASRSRAEREGPTAVLDPFKVHAQGEDVLRRELVALDSMHLRNIALAYGFADSASVSDPGLGRPELAALIVNAVRDRLAEEERKGSR